MIEQTTMRRLAFIKYLYQTGVSQSRAPTPLNCASILMMHDAVELFLQLASEHLNAGAKRLTFMDYWKILNEKLSDNSLGQEESMRRLNSARVALKHHGTFPSDLDIEAFRTRTASFFEDNTPLVFGTTLNEVSLIDFVNPESSRERLKEAQDHIDKNDTLSALDDIAIAFEEMIEDYETRKIDKFHRLPFYFGENVHLSRFALPFHERELSAFTRGVEKSIEEMREVLKILALGIDYRRFSKFKQLSPFVVQFANGTWAINGRPEGDRKPSIEDTKFCMDFVIESALKLAEFDYEAGSLWST